MDRRRLKLALNSWIYANMARAEEIGQLIGNTMQDAFKAGYSEGYREGHRDATRGLD